MTKLVSRWTAPTVLSLLGAAFAGEGGCYSSSKVSESQGIGKSETPLLVGRAPLPYANPLTAADARKAAARHRVIDGALSRIRGDATSADVRVQMRLLGQEALRYQTSQSSVDWAGQTGSPGPSGT